MKKIIVALVLVLSATPLFAKQALTTEQVGKWMDSVEAMEKWSDSHPELVRKLRDQARAMREQQQGMPSFQRSVAATRAAGLVDQVQAVIEPYGFASLDEWGAFGDRIMAAFMALNMEKTHASEMIARQLEQLDRDTSLSPEQKQMMRQQLQSMSQMMQSFASAPKADIEAVRPLLSRFEAFGRKKMNQGAQ